MSNLSGHGQLTGVMSSGGGSGGGSEVIINPSGAAIGTMEKISVDGDIYEVRNVPDATSASNGDVLTRSASGVGWYPPTKELPVFTSSDNNKVLKINNDTLTWETIPKELPNILTSDEGKVLTVSNGAPTWQEAGGGGSIEYSTTEHIIGTWVDGSDVYEKAINYTDSTPHGDSPFNVIIIENANDIIECSLMYSDSGLQNGRYNPLNDNTSQVNFDMYGHRLYKENNTLVGYFAGSSGTLKIVGVVRYTKVGE